MSERLIDQMIEAIDNAMRLRREAQRLNANGLRARDLSIAADARYAAACKTVLTLNDAYRSAQNAAV